MSCYQVSDEHISAIIKYACRANISAGWGGNPGRYAYRPGAEQEACNILFAANVKSVNARYKENSDTAGCVYLIDAPVLTAIQVIKAINCLEYQCDEWAEFSGSEAQQILRDIKAQAITNLPGYDDAAWSI